MQRLKVVVNWKCYLDIEELGNGLFMQETPIKKVVNRYSHFALFTEKFYEFLINSIKDDVTMPRKGLCEFLANQ